MRVLLELEHTRGNYVTGWVFGSVAGGEGGTWEDLSGFTSFVVGIGGD